jgi:hypothetical protein
VRAYAARLADSLESRDERRTALTQLFDHYLATAATAIDSYPAEAHRRPSVRPADSPAPPIADPATALAWLEAERANLVATCAHTAAHGWPDHTTRLATTLFRYLDVGGHYPDALAIHSHSRSAAAQTGDRTAEAHALTNLGGVHWRQGRYSKPRPTIDWPSRSSRKSATRAAKHALSQPRPGLRPMGAPCAGRRLFTAGPHPLS